MNHKDFIIGGYFFTGSGRWKCTDIGTRTIIAMKVPLDPNLEVGEVWGGPPYLFAEEVFDEYDMDGCDLENRFEPVAPSPEDDIEYARRIGGYIRGIPKCNDASTDMVEHRAPINTYPVSFMDDYGNLRCAGCGDELSECWCGIPDCQ